METIDELYLTVRAYNCLVAANLRCRLQVERMTDRELLRCRGLGPTTLADIRACIPHRYGPAVELLALAPWYVYACPM